MERKVQQNNEWKRTAINLFVLFHLFIFVFWGMPRSMFRDKLVHNLERYVLWTGIWHGWDMFAPEPLNTNFKLEAEIIFADGSKKIWECPRMDKLGIFERYPKERWRKWLEHVRLDASSMIWEDTVKWVARKYWNDSNPPKRVSLIRYWTAIPPPFPAVDRQPIPKEYQFENNYRFKVYDFAPGEKP